MISLKCCSTAPREKRTHTRCLWGIAAQDPLWREQLRFSGRVLATGGPQLTEAVTFCPGYKIRHVKKCSHKCPGVRGSRLQPQCSFKGSTCDAGVNEPCYVTRTLPPRQPGTGTFCPPYVLEHVATPNPSCLPPPDSHQLPPQKLCLASPGAAFLASPSAAAQGPDPSSAKNSLPEKKNPPNTIQGAGEQGQSQGQTRRDLEV